MNPPEEKEHEERDPFGSWYETNAKVPNGRGGWKPGLRWEFRTGDAGYSPATGRPMPYEKPKPEGAA